MATVNLVCARDSDPTGLSCGARPLQAGSQQRTAQGMSCLLHLTVKNTTDSPAIFLGRFQLPARTRTGPVRGPALSGVIMGSMLPPAGATERW